MASESYEAYAAALLVWEEERGMRGLPEAAWVTLHDPCNMTQAA
jgi:hypothetical protein